MKVPPIKRVDAPNAIRYKERVSRDGCPDPPDRGVPKRKND